MLSKIMKEDLKWACKYALLEVQNENVAGLNPKQLAKAKNFIKHEATYEQLMNLAFTPQKGLYLESDLLEGMFLEGMNVFAQNNVSASELVMEGISANIGKSYNGAKSKILASASDAIGYIDEVSKQNKKRVMAQLDALKKNYPDAYKHISNNGMWYIAGAAALAVISAVIYKKYLSKDMDSCKNAKDPKQCLVNNRRRAMQKTIGELKRARGGCRRDANPERCNAKMDRQIKRWQDKFEKIS